MYILEWSLKGIEWCYNYCKRECGDEGGDLDPGTPETQTAGASVFAPDTLDKLTLKTHEYDDNYITLKIPVNATSIFILGTVVLILVLLTICNFYHCCKNINKKNRNTIQYDQVAQTDKEDNGI